MNLLCPCLPNGRDCRLLIETHIEATKVERECQLRILGHTVRIIRPVRWRTILRVERPLADYRWLAAWHGSWT